jgi:hypothetical protein
LAKPHSLRLLNAFSKINGEATRSAVLHLVETISQIARPTRSRKRKAG